MTKIGGYTHGKRNPFINITQRFFAVESLCVGLITFLHDAKVREVERSAAKIAKMKTDLKASKLKKSLQKRKPIKRPRKIKR